MCYVPIRHDAAIYGWPMAYPSVYVFEFEFVPQYGLQLIMEYAEFVTQLIFTILPRISLLQADID